MATRGQTESPVVLPTGEIDLIIDNNNRQQQHAVDSATDEMLTEEQKTWCQRVCRGLSFMMLGFLVYICLNAWVRAFMTGDYRGVGLSTFLFIMILFACVKRDRMPLESEEPGEEYREADGSDLERGVSQEKILQLDYFIWDSKAASQILKYEAEAVEAGTGGVGGASGECRKMIAKQEEGGAAAVAAFEVDEESHKPRSTESFFKNSTARDMEVLTMNQLEEGKFSEDDDDILGKPEARRRRIDAATSTTATTDGDDDDDDDDVSNRDVTDYHDISAVIPYGASECSICLCEYEQDEQLCRLPCKHVFHSCCLVKWLNNHRVCPKCRYDVMEDPLSNDHEAGSSAGHTSQQLIDDMFSSFAGSDTDRGGDFDDDDSRDNDDVRAGHRESNNHSDVHSRQRRTNNDRGMSSSSINAAPAF